MRDTKINENSKSKYESNWIQHKLEKIKEIKKKQIFRDKFKILEGAWYSMETRKPTLKVDIIKVTLRKLEFGNKAFFLSESEILNQIVTKIINANGDLDMLTIVL